MKFKLTYLGDLMMAMDKFDNSRNVNEMKEFLLKVILFFFFIMIFLIKNN